MDLKLKDKTIFITGGNSGIGKAVAMQYALEGNLNIVISFNNNRQKANELIKPIEAYGNSVIAVKIDFSDSSSIENAMTEIKQRYGTVHILVNNAVRWPKPEYRGSSFESLSMQGWKEI